MGEKGGLIHSQFGVEDFSKAVSDECEACHSEHDEKAREDRHPPLAADDILTALCNHQSPLRGRELGSQSDKAQTRNPEDAVTRIDRGLHNDGGETVGKNMGEQDADSGAPTATAAWTYSMLLTLIARLRDIRAKWGI